jgi:hypothetical protein
VRRAQGSCGVVAGVLSEELCAPPGVVMVAPPESSRNAEGAQSEGRVVGVVQ